jgi:hypothetical protein
MGTRLLRQALKGQCRSLTGLRPLLFGFDIPLRRVKPCAIAGAASRLPMFSEWYYCR